MKTALPTIGIRPTIDGRRLGVRESLEDQTMNMAKAAAVLIEANIRHASGEPVKCVIADTCIGGPAEAAACADKFKAKLIFTTIWARKLRMTWRTNRNITAYGRRRCHRQSVMTGFITIRSILPVMTLLMTKSDGSSMP